MKNLTIIAIITAILCSCATTKNVKPVAKNDLINVVSDFNNHLTDDSIAYVSIYDVQGRVIHHHIEQVDELVMQEAGIYVVHMESANGLVFVRKCMNKGDGVFILGAPIVIKQEYPKYDVDLYKRERNKIQ